MLHGCLTVTCYEHAALQSGSTKTTSLGGRRGKVVLVNVPKALVLVQEVAVLVHVETLIVFLEIVIIEIFKRIPKVTTRKREWLLLRNNGFFLYKSKLIPA